MKLTSRFEEIDDDTVALVVRLTWPKAELWHELSYFFRSRIRPVGPAETIENQQRGIDHDKD